MHWCGLLIIGVAACSTADSVAIEIETHDPAIVRVELFIGAAPCTNCDGIAPPGTDPTLADSKPLGDVSFVVGTDRFDTAVERDGIAGFLIKPDAQNATVPKLAAIGFDSTGAPLGFVVDDTGFDLGPLLGTKRRYQLESRTVQQAMGTGDDQIVTWRTDGDDPVHPPPSCLAIVRRDGHTEFFVPEADPDCDGFVAPNECMATWYKYKQPAAADPPECLVSTVDACEIGQSGTCIDGATAPTCTSLDKICVPQVACTTCMPPYTDACLTSIAATGTRLHCQIPVFTDSQASPTTCISASGLISLDQYYGSPCTVGFVHDNSGNIGSSIDITSTNGDVAGTLDLTGFAPACNFGFSTTITVDHLPAANTPTVAKGALAITQGSGARTLLMPVVVTYVNGGPITSCIAPPMKPECKILPDISSDTLWKCTAHQ